MQNAVQQAFAHGVQSLHWEVARVGQYGAASIRTFLHQEQVADYLVAHCLDAAHIDVHACVRCGMSWAKSNPRPKIANRKRQPTKAMLPQDAYPNGFSSGELKTEDLDAAELLLTIQAGLAPTDQKILSGSAS
ncbi:MAG: hypothetical protein VYC64_08440, partial [Candidatus Latescibacterota bacterium]|nr:hypothetical protein [Candidatus Latescibacterota bacterium]